MYGAAWSSKLYAAGSKPAWHTNAVDMYLFVFLVWFYTLSALYKLPFLGFTLDRWLADVTIIVDEVIAALMIPLMDINISTIKILEIVITFVINIIDPDMRRMTNCS
jgi:hypothetical protein